MIISFAEENINEYAYNFSKDMCVFDLSIKREGSWEDAVEQISDLLDEKSVLFKKGTLYLWLKSESRKNPSRLEKIKGIWNNSKFKWLFKERCLLFSHSDVGGEFCSVLANIDKTQLASCLNFLRTNSTAFLFFATRKIQSTMIDSYLSEQYSDFEKVVSFLLEKNMIYIRVSGNFDDRELYVDFFGKKELLVKKFKFCLNVD